MINDGCYGDEAQILLLDERDMLTSVSLDSAVLFELTENNEA